MTSIIIPIYNAAPYLGQCLDSLRAQTIADWEAVLVDDASEDDSVKVAEEYVAKDERFRLLRQEKNRGQSAARNRGLEAARGEYIAFLDADDWWDADCLEKHLATIEGYDMVQSGYKRCTIQHAQHTILKEKTPRHHWQFTSACMRLYKRKSIEGLRFEEGLRYEDVLWTVDVLLQGPSVRMLNYTGYNYRLTPNSTTSEVHKADRKRVMDILRKKPQTGITRYTRLKLQIYWLLGR